MSLMVKLQWNGANSLTANGHFNTDFDQLCGSSVPHLLPMLLFLVFFYCRCFGFYPLQTQNVAPHCPSGLAMRAVISNSEKRIDGQRKCNEVQQRQNVGPNLAKHSWIWIWVDQNCTLWFFFNIAVDNQPLEILLAGI